MMAARLTPAQRAELIAAYRDGVRAVRSALDGITVTELDRRPGPDEWSAREIVHHLADSEMTSAIRLRRLLAEVDPEIPGYDEPAYARRFRYAERPVDSALLALEGARGTSAEILDGLDAFDWARTGRHSESGPYGVERWLEIYARHAHDHADQIRRARSGPG
jgi:hypothetical protein